MLLHSRFLQGEQQHLFGPSVITLSTLALAGVNTSYLTSTNVIDDGFNRNIQVETLLGVSMSFHTEDSVLCIFTQSTTFASAELHSRKCLPGYVLNYMAHTRLVNVIQTIQTYWTA